jgi:hypothetical protein
MMTAGPVTTMIAPKRSDTDQDSRPTKWASTVPNNLLRGMPMGHQAAQAHARRPHFVRTQIQSALE